MPLWRLYFGGWRMSITAIKGRRGEEQAFCTCEDCGGEVTVSARHGSGQGGRGKPVMTLHSEAAVVETLRKQGWTYVKHRLRCDKCSKKKADPVPETELSTIINKQKEAAMTVKTAPREMSQETRLDIMEALFAAYDRKAKRYTGTETDASVANAIGGGCMPGWVAQVRQDNFGPAGNEEAEAIRAEIAKLRDETVKKLDALASRLDALYRAEDKRVRA